MKFSGGRLLLFEYADFLKKRGHDVKILLESERGGLAGSYDVNVLPEFSRKYISDCDCIIATAPKEVEIAFNLRRGPVVHLCQGLEILDLQNRIKGKSIPRRYQKSGLINKIKLSHKKKSWKKKIERFEKIYNLPTRLLAVSDPIKKYLENKFKREVLLCRNGIPLNIFYPNEKFLPEKFSADKPMKIINVASMDVECKCVKDTLEIIQKAREEGLHIDFTRITPEISKYEKEKLFEYKLYEKLSRKEIADLMRKNDVYISNSGFQEGFGLPAVEAMACGLICVLSDIPAYRSFSENQKHCVYVPQKDIQGSVNALKKIYNMKNEQKMKLRENALKLVSGFSHENACLNFEKIISGIVKK